MWLEGEVILWAQKVEVQRGGEAHYRGATSLVSADFQSVRVGTDLVSVMDHIGGQRVPPPLDGLYDLYVLGGYGANGIDAILWWRMHRISPSARPHGMRPAPRAVCVGAKLHMRRS